MLRRKSIMLLISLQHSTEIWGHQQTRVCVRNNIYSDDMFVSRYKSFVAEKIYFLTMTYSFFILFLAMKVREILLP